MAIGPKVAREVKLRWSGFTSHLPAMNDYVTNSSLRHSKMMDQDDRKLRDQPDQHKPEEHRLGSPVSPWYHTILLHCAPPPAALCDCRSVYPSCPLLASCPLLSLIRSCCRLRPEFQQSLISIEDSWIARKALRQTLMSHNDGLAAASSPFDRDRTFASRAFIRRSTSLHLGILCATLQ